MKKELLDSSAPGSGQKWGLDEAANHWADTEGSYMSFVKKQDVIDTFKAGASWASSAPESGGEQTKEQLKTSLEMTQLGWNTTIDKKEELQNQVKALSAIKKGLEKSLTEAFAEIEKLKATPPTKESGGDEKDKEIAKLKERIEYLRNKIGLKTLGIWEQDKKEIARLKALVSDTATELQERINTGLTEIKRLKGLLKQVVFQSYMNNAIVENYSPQEAEKIANTSWQRFAKQNGLTV